MHTPTTAGPRRAVGRVTGAAKAVTRVPGAGLVMVPPKLAWFTASTWWRSRDPYLADELALHPTELPARPPTAAFIAQVAMDEAILGLLKSPKRYPTREEMARVAGELRATVVHHERHGFLEEPRTYHRTPAPLRDIDVRWGRTHELKFERMSWDSGYLPHDGAPGRDRWLSLAANRTAYAAMVRHPEPDRPWLLCLHGLGTGGALADFFAFRAHHLFHDLGLNLVFPVLPLHGPRRTGRLSGQEFMSYDLAGLIHGMAQAMWDIRRLIGWLREEQRASRIGAYGISVGGYTAALLATLEPSLDMVLAGVPLADIPGLFAAHSPPALRRLAREDGLIGEVADRAHRVVSPLAMVPQVVRDRRFVYAGLGDRMTTPRQAQRLWLHWDQPSINWFDGNHLAFMWSAPVRRYVDDAIGTSLVAA